jgi:deoxyhypusine synthase
LGTIKDYLVRNYRHFNSASLIDAAEAWKELVDGGGKMMVTLGGAMSSAELGISLAELIRQDKVHALTVTGANLEEDVFNLVAHDSYVRIPNYRDLTPKDEKKLLDSHLNRVTDTCIPEGEAMRKIESHFLKFLADAQEQNLRLFPHEVFYGVLRTGVLESEYEIDPKDSWLLAACERNLPIIVPGWEDSTIGNKFVAATLQGKFRYDTIRSGLEYMGFLAKWYYAASQEAKIGFFQVGGGITGDFPICVVPMLEQDLKRPVPKWSYFCQISDSTTSYGSYSGAVPNEKITWGKLDVDTPKFMIESDATIVFPLVAAYLMDI